MKLITLLLILVIASCSKGPEKKVLQSQLQNKIEKQYQESLFKLTDFTRRGSYTFSNNGPHGLIYYKAELELLSDYQFNQWDQLGAGSLINVMGSTPAGITGISSEGNKKGDLLKVYGSLLYKIEEGKWQLSENSIASASGGQTKGKVVSDLEEESKLDERNLPTFQKYLKKLKKLSKQMVKNPSDFSNLESELKNVLLEAEIKGEKNNKIIKIASGEEGGEYFKFGQAMMDHLKIPSKKIKSFQSLGSGHNIELVLKGDVDYGIAQNDILNRFFQGGQLDLTALMVLFPEAIHVVVLKDSSFRNIQDLDGKKINIGPEKSGNHINAKEILAAHSLDLNKQILLEFDLKSAMKKLRNKEIDALFFTGAPPHSALVEFSQKAPIHLLPLEGAILDGLSKEHHFIKLNLPANSYLGHDIDYYTLGVTSVLFTKKERSNEEVKELLNSLFEKQNSMSSYTSNARAYSTRNWQRGLSIPAHSAALEYFNKL